MAFVPSSSEEEEEDTVDELQTIGKVREVLVPVVSAV